ncbi:MAG: hypothetical protein ACREQ5_02635 [Candidatus Dormibacteria bacterium]
MPTLTIPRDILAALLLATTKSSTRYALDTICVRKHGRATVANRRRSWFIYADQSAAKPKLKPKMKPKPSRSPE